MNSFTWGTSQKGQTLIILDGHEFQKKRDTKTTTHWRCSKWRSYKCPKTLIYSGSDIVSQSNEHSHEHQNAVCGLARTTNAVEGWHLGVTALFQGSHPSIHTFLEKIQLDSYNQKFNILKAPSGTINLSRKKYRDLNEKVQQITSSYTDSNLLSYIRSLAHLTI